MAESSSRAGGRTPQRRRRRSRVIRGTCLRQRAPRYREGGGPTVSITTAGCLCPCNRALLIWNGGPADKRDHGTDGRRETDFNRHWGRSSEPYHRTIRTDQGRRYRGLRDRQTAAVKSVCTYEASTGRRGTTRRGTKKIAGERVSGRGVEVRHMGGIWGGVPSFFFSSSSCLRPSPPSKGILRRVRISFGPCPGGHFPALKLRTAPVILAVGRRPCRPSRLPRSPCRE